MQKISSRRRKVFNPVLILNIIISICSFFLLTAATFNTVSAHSGAIHVVQHAQGNCPSPGDPTSQSLLVVLLDRSGSLIVKPGATDPKGYSTSVTKALANLWPGRMAVIPFRGDTTSLPIIGPYALSDPTQLTDLQNKIQNYPIGGGTPLAAAMHEALGLLQNAPSGSRVVVITDGAPTGTLPHGTPTAGQEQDIRNNLIPQFCSKGITVSAFGLTINDSNANQLLTDITSGTGATYNDVTSPENLAKAVISLYADWQHLNFTSVSGQDNFPVSIDSFAQSVKIVTFRSDSNYNVTLDGPDGQPVQGIQPSVDRHYVIDSLAGSVFVHGTYIVHTSGDPDAQVYALINSPLHLQIISPTAQQLYYGSPIHIKAQILNGLDVLTPEKGQAQLIAHVTLLVNGRPIGSTNDIVLNQQGTTFEGQTQTYSQAGVLQIEIDGSYQGVQRGTRTGVQLVPPPSCKLGLLGCLWQEHHSQILGIGIPLLILFLLLLALLIWLMRWRRLPEPTGYLVNVINGRPLNLGTDRPLLARIFSKSTITMKELAQHPQATIVAPLLLGEPLAFVATNTGTSLRLMQGTSSTISVVTDGKEQKFGPLLLEIPLGNSSEIRKSDIPADTFQRMVPSGLAISLIQGS